MHYVPVEDVDRTLLTPTDTTTFCPFKGDASYWSVIDGDADAVWGYESPYPAVQAIAGHVAFYSDRVTIEVSPEGA